MRLFSGAFNGRCWRALGYLLLGLPVTGLGWAVALTAVIAGTMLGLTVVGVLAVPLLLVLVRAAADLERWRCGLVGPDRPDRPYRPLPPGSAGARRRVRLTDPATWRDLLWLLFAAPLNDAAALAVCILWTVALALISLPISYRYLPDGRATLYHSGGVPHGVVDSVATALPWALAGLVLLWVTGWTTRGAGAGLARCAAALLAPTQAARLRGQVATLASTRAAAVAGQHRELNRIERDLHDGAQARLVALSADLGMADEAFDTDPAQARQLVEQARDGVILALAELRDLVRGIGPPVLRDRGLAAALESITARSPIPVTATVSLPRRPDPTVEDAAYFVVCEALANAAKHSHATSVRVDVAHRAEVAPESRTFRVCVADDGVGGADPRGAGLAGLADRVAAVDGRFTVDSPPGGPTTVEAVLPCGW
jgi:signal transduction histidine kinase